MGKTGYSLAKLLGKQHTLYLYDDDPTRTKIAAADIPLDIVDLVILSPGVSLDSPLIAAAYQHGIPVTSELQYCFDRCPAPCISVTGTNGKTTTTEMIHHVLQGVGKRSYLLGNGGVPFAEKLNDIDAGDMVVLESSSFQLNFATAFTPYISILLNISADHLNIHHTYGDYVAAKTNNFIHQTERQYAIFNYDDDEAVAASSLACCRRLYYSASSVDTNCHYAGGVIITDIDGDVEMFKDDWLSTQQRHNQSNILAAVLALKLCGVSIEDTINSLKSYSYLPHRYMTVGDFGGVTFINDSKATNIHATLSALDETAGEVALIVGGSDKGLDFTPLFDHVGNVTLLVLIGETSSAVAATAAKCGYNTVASATSMYDAVHLAYTHFAGRSGTVLLSPASASFDMFTSYAHRGQVFIDAVRTLTGGSQ
jgi:UDP-N-acetylmuramoylalanine--D-glutamate ligase